MISLILMLVALIVYIIGFSTRHFIDIDEPTYKIHFGLWDACASISGQTICKDTAEGTNVGNKGWFKAWRATSILGLIFLFAAIICSGLKLFAFKEKKYILIAGICMTFAAVVFILIASIVFTHNDDDHFGALGLYFDYGYSLDLTIVGMCIAVIAGVFMVVDYNTGLHIDDGQVANY
ncbi:Hypothetical predicted protein [Mytilus galloprovincialis]|uniref:Uncharacterized protein n=1 Tax=Mytilus galloprovincialis TaxID=29158 RepID=A0A8B6E0M6_MYTGA|nr:Hypothetical predicted protein [Mytilus galloprovincialis]